MDCPFCGWKSESKEEYEMLVHMETYHPEGGKSPFVPDEDMPKPTNGTDELDGAGDGYVECPIEGCNEVLVRDELEYHLELHSEEAGEAGEDGATHAPTPTPDPGSRMQDGPHPAQPPQVSGGDTSKDSYKPAPKAKPQSTIAAWRSILAMPGRRPSKKTDSNGNTISTGSNGAGNKRAPMKLGKAELGRYHDEQRMPDWLVAHLQKNEQVVGKDVIPVLKQLLEQSTTTSYAYLCHPCAWHVSKLRLEGGFCGYRNIQMLSSYIIGAEFEGSHHFGGKLPTIFQIQEFIEDAWDKGINKQGRVETGGVRGSRKYIGTPEAQAMFVSLGVPCEAQGFKNKTEPGKAEAQLLVHVERYFQQGVFNPEDKVRCTQLPPIYFQHAGHSMTIVGIEKDLNGAANLLVFDPMFRDSAVILERAGRKFSYKYPEHALKAYRRGHSYLKRYREFEVLRLKPPMEALTGN
ncbi:Zinc finger with UFM1-specific peptidase domain protein [Cytospora mali]|uniref:Zinc finger with UFM1-specific peptidase domain protein n=1 Tax=Cytospora mali TaxID=578113 RepID=A0A194V4I3_CYTMA|nr:Zinc finger with UFM1-specific peptidase domain protein [Valsa mali var. pyri (nom. inval.)]